MTHDPLTPITRRSADPIVLPHPKPNAFGYGLLALMIGVAIAVWIPEPKPFQIAVFGAIIGLGGAGIASGIAGILEIETKWLTAGGPLAVFVFLCFFIAKIAAPQAFVNWSPEKSPQPSFGIEGQRK